MNSVREIDIKNCMHCFFYDMINFKNLDPNNSKMRTSSVKPFYLIINKVSGYIDEHNGSKYLTLVHTDKDKDALKKYGELWKKSKILLDQEAIA